MHLQCLMLCRDATYDETSHLQIEDGGLALLVTDELPIALEVDLAVRFVRGYLESDKPAAVRLRIIDEDGNGPAPFGVDADAIRPEIRAQLAGQNYEMPCSVVFSLANHRVGREGDYRIDVTVNGEMLGHVQFRVVHFPKPPPELAELMAAEIPGPNLPIWT
jgi:hypothetical protein